MLYLSGARSLFSLISLYQYFRLLSYMKIIKPHITTLSVRQYPFKRYQDHTNMHLLGVNMILKGTTNAVKVSFTFLSNAFYQNKLRDIL